MDCRLQVRWDQRYRDSDRLPEPSRVLRENLHLLPRRGTALDLACGLGASALLLAEQGLRVHAWDLSAVALDRLAREAAQRGIYLDIECRDVVANPPPGAGFVHSGYETEKPGGWTKKRRARRRS